MPGPPTPEARAAASGGRLRAAGRRPGFDRLWLDAGAGGAEEGRTYGDASSTADEALLAVSPETDPETKPWEAVDSSLVRWLRLPRLLLVVPAQVTADPDPVALVMVEQGADDDAPLVENIPSDDSAVCPP